MISTENKSKCFPEEFLFVCHNTLFVKHVIFDRVIVSSAQRS